MMKRNNTIAVIYFDDMQMVGCIARVSYGQTVTPLATVRKEYSGIHGSNFADREDFSSTLSAVATELAQQVNRVPEILYIGVANQFCHVETQTSEIEFDRMTKVNHHHLQALWNDTQFNEENCEIIAKQALYYKLEEYEDVLIDCLGVATSGLEMASSALSVDNEFRALIDGAAIEQAGFRYVDFVSVAAAELFMIPEKARDGGCTLVHCDFFSTSVANVLGDGLTHLSHFNLGAGQLVNEIVESFGVDYESATKLLLQSTPTFEMLLKETYSANGQTIPAGIFNDFINRRLKDFATNLANFETAKVIYLSGGNFAQIYGIRNMISNICDRRVYSCQDVLTGQSNYPESTVNALVRYIYHQ